jgi:eukaryotic-like serine/threonine-protein kinase
LKKPVPEIKNALLPGDLVGHYQILGIAGAGGMGIVYKAFDQKLERTVALKFLPSSLLSGSKEKNRFLREARAASSLDHPNIGGIHGIDETQDGKSYIVMVFYDGESLSREIRNGPLPFKKAVDIGIQMALGLDHAHRRKIVHRDIKPSNVMVTADGIAKIVDFGLARPIKSEVETETGSTAGTVGYMSPEQTLGKLSDHRTDIWAWGIVFAEMLTGCNPFWRGTVPATVNAILYEAPQAMDLIPESVQAVVYRALAKNPQDRYQDCRDVVRDLESVNAQINSSADQVDLSASTRSIDSEQFKNYASAAQFSSEKDANRKRARTRFLVVSTILVLLILGFVGSRSVRGHFKKLAIVDQQKHIAVLPFDNIGGDSANAVLAEGLMDTMAGKLSNLAENNRSLWVVPVSEIRRRNINDPSTARRDLGATLVVTGSLQREGQDFHLTVNLIDTKSLRQIGSVVREDRSGDLSTLQDQAVSELARLMSVPENAAKGNAIEKPAAYEYYLKAVGFMQRYDRPGNLDQAIESLQQAVQADPKFALAYGQLGEAYRLKYQLDQNSKWLDDALSNCRRAAELDNKITSVYVTLGRIHEISGKHDLAIEEFQRALDQDPRNAEALGGIAHAYENAGHIEEAEMAYKKSIALRPEYWNGYEELGIFYDNQGKYPEAVTQLRQAISITPDNAQVYVNLGAVYSDTGDPKMFPQAEKSLKKSLEISPSYAAYANLGNLYYLEKRYSESAAMTEKALQLNGNDYRVWSNLIAAYKWLKETDKTNAAREQLLAVLIQTTTLKPQDALAQSILAIIYAEKKLKEKALTKIQTALALSPDDPEVLENVGITYEQLGYRQRALDYVKKALQKGFAPERVAGDADLQNLVADSNFRPNKR